MSLLHIGSACHVCHLVDFLPTACAQCHEIFCKDHLHRHDCPTSEAIILESGGQGSNWQRTACELQGCERPRIEAIAGLENGLTTPEGVAKEVRCPGCGKAFCVSHRAQGSHGCSAPLIHNARHDAILERKERARAIMAERFPETAGRVRRTLPPQKDKVDLPRAQPSRGPEKAQALAQAQASRASGNGIEEPNMAPRVKTRAEKMNDLAIRKLRSLAKPLLPRWAGDSAPPRRFFEWGVLPEGEGGKGLVDQWQRIGKWHGAKLQPVWVPTDIPIGKILDILVEQSKTVRPASNSQNELVSVCLSAPPDGERKVISLDLSRTADSIIEGAVVLLHMRPTT